MRATSIIAPNTFMLPHPPISQATHILTPPRNNSTNLYSLSPNKKDA